MHRSPSRLVRAAVLAAGLACVAAPTAMADSIVYVDGGNVWSATPDGSHKVQLTDGGNWHSPTQADDGTIAAVQGEGPIQVMAPDGRPLHTITTPSAPSGDGGTFAPRPVDLSFSPDGKRIAYAYVANSCPVASSCGTIQRSTFYTEANVTEATPHSVYGNQFGVSDPEWVTNGRTLVFGGSGSQVSIDDLGPGDYSHVPWMTPNADQGDGEVSRDGRHLATTFFYGDDTLIAFFKVVGDVKTETPPEQPLAACNTTNGDAEHADPTWSPDGWGIAYQSSKGIEVGRFSKIEDNSCESADVGSGILTPTGESPDWGPANPPAARWQPPAADPPVVIDPIEQPGEPTPPSISFTKPKTTLKALRKGLVVKVAAPAAGKVTVTLKKGRKTVAKGSKAAKAAGQVKVKLSKVPARKARKLRGKKLKLTVAQAGAPSKTAGYRFR